MPKNLKDSRGIMVAGLQGCGKYARVKVCRGGPGMER
jgi:hypothetical protein